MWYFLNYNPEPEIFKVTYQTKQLFGKALEIKEEFSDIYYDELLKDDNAVIDYIEIKSSSIYTDILWDYLFRGEIKILSEKVTNILKDYNLLNVKFYKTIVKKGKAEKIYFSLRGFGEIYDYINYDESTFSWYKTDNKETVVLKFKNSLEYRNMCKKFGPVDSISPLNIFMNIDFLQKDYDLISLGYLHPCSFIINEKLKEKLENERVVGFEFKPCDFIRD